MAFRWSCSHAFRLPSSSLASLLGSRPALAEPAHTTRIETRPFYGAVVTIEHGVRVYRPVPPTQHLIVNPDGTTPLQLNIGAGGSASFSQNAQTAPRPTAEASAQRLRATCRAARDGRRAP